MTFYQIIKAGKKLTVDTKGTGYTPTTFFYKDGKIWLKNRELGTFPHPTFNGQTFNNHIAEMLKEGLNIITE